MSNVFYRVCLVVEAVCDPVGREEERREEVDVWNLGEAGTAEGAAEKARAILRMVREKGVNDENASTATRGGR